jgi:hypothetical protein
MAGSRQQRRQRGAKSVFDRQQLGPSQLRTVAQRRLRDARALLDLQENERLNGAMYLAGFTVECLLKAELLRVHGWLRSAAPAPNQTKDQRLLRDLCYRSHDLVAIRERLPESVSERLARFDQHEMKTCWQRLGEICGSWTIFARYSPTVATRADATAFLDNVEEVSRCLA